MDGYDEYLRLGREGAAACRRFRATHGSWAGGFYGIDIQLDGPLLLRVAPPWLEEFGTNDWRWFVDDVSTGDPISDGTFGVLDVNEVEEAVAGLLTRPRLLLGRPE